MSERDGDASRLSPGCIRFKCEFIFKKGRYSLEILSSRQKQALEKKLRYYENFSVASLRSNSKVKLRDINLKEWRRAPSKYQQRQIREKLSEEIAGLGPECRFRVSGKMRVVGYLLGNIFFVIWVDPNHEMGK